MPNKRRGGSGTVAERKTAAAGRGEHAGKVIPTDQLVSVLENLLAPATGLCWKATTRNRPISSRACWRKLIRKIHDLHMIMPSVGRSEHLDLFEKVLPASWISLSPAPRACAFRNYWKMACSKSAPSTPILNSTRACTSICRQTSR